MAHEREDGFTLIELLIVVLIMGILAAIAVPAFLNQREKAWARAALSDLSNAAIRAEEYFNDNMTYAGLASSDFKVSDGDRVSISSATVDGYCLEADHQNLPAAPDFHFDLALGRPVAGACGP
jgi:type IV pilus assembly protein PilA